MDEVAQALKGLNDYSLVACHTTPQEISVQCRFMFYCLTFQTHTIKQEFTTVLSIALH